jgi:hypothetical protein
MIEISCTVTIESFHLMTFILENVLFAINYFIVTTGTLIPSTTTAGPVSTKSSPKVASVSSTVLPESTTSSTVQGSQFFLSY